MKNFWTALFTKFITLDGLGDHNDFWDDIGGRLFKDQAPEATEYPYAVVSLVSDNPDYTFSETFEDCLIQFDVFSNNLSSVEIEDAMTHLKTLFDNCSFSITSDTLIWFWRQGSLLTVEDEETPEGTRKILHYSIDYSVKLQRA